MAEWSAKTKEQVRMDTERVKSDLMKYIDDNLALFGDSTNSKIIENVSDINSKIESLKSEINKNKEEQKRTLRMSVLVIVIIQGVILWLKLKGN